MKTAVELARKAVFICYFPSDGHPMLLEWLHFAIQEDSRPG